VTALRGDAVAAQALGMNRVVSEDALRRALSRIDSHASDQWLRPALLSSVRDALDRPWILDIDASIKPLYGRHTEGAELGYNTHKPGWLTTSPAMSCTPTGWATCAWVADVQVSPGKQHSSVHAKAGLVRLLDELGEHRPALVRGDCGYGNEAILVALEARAQHYLLRLRQTKNVQRLIAR
jgi:Transposase DDE domain group 1